VLDVVALARERANQGFADRGIVFDHQEARHGTGGYGAARSRESAGFAEPWSFPVRRFDGRRESWMHDLPHHT
jgi:hypothetical protein